MLNLSEDLKPIGYYIKDRERMLKEMFRCVRGHKLQAILPDGLKVTLIESYDRCCDDDDEYKTKHKRRRRMIHSRLTGMNVDLFFFMTNLNSHKQVRLIIDPCFR